MDYHQERLEYTIKVLKALTKNQFNIKESDELPDNVSGLTRNNHPILSMFALPTNWTIYFENETATTLKPGTVKNGLKKIGLILNKRQSPRTTFNFENMIIKKR